jgi:8-oxo-dGTP pyrophosphatase MutT (NUDIX family)
MLRNDLVSALTRPPMLLTPTAGFSAVAAIFDRRYELLLIQRALRPGDPWSGHLSFPGGRVEAGESALAAALRETFEETELTLPEQALLGQLDDVAALGGRPGMVIRPFVFHDDSLDLRTFSGTFRSNVEVAAVHGLALEDLLADRGRGSMPYHRGEMSFTLPCVDFEGLRLWGLTLHMVDDLLHRLDGRGMGLARRAPV